MKRLIIYIVIFVFGTAALLYAADNNSDSAKAVPKTDSSKYQNFIDQNNNGVDDNLEQQRRETTKVEPKRDAEGSTDRAVEKTTDEKSVPDNKIEKEEINKAADNQPEKKPEASEKKPEPR